MKVLIINPPPYKILEPFYDTPDYPRTTLAFLAAFLRERAIDVSVLDCKYDRLDYNDAMIKVKEISPDIVGFTAFTNEIIQAGQLARMVKDYNKKIKIIIGGVHVTALQRRTMEEFPQFDIGILGEGEEILFEVLKQIENNEALNDLMGICYFDKNGEYIQGDARPFIMDQDSLPMPAWDMFRPAKGYMLHTSRGCPFHCPFCMNPNGRKVRARSAGKVLEEIECLFKISDPKTIWFGDEVFTINRERTMELCSGMIDRGFNKKFSWTCASHVRAIDLEMLQLMRKAGCNDLGLGIESGSDERLKDIKKGTTLEGIINTVKIVKKSRIPFTAFFILGQPNETQDSLKQTIDFAVKINPDLPIFGIMVPYPGTRVGDMALAGEGGYILQAKDWNDYNKQLGDALSINGISRKALEKMQFFGYLKVFIYNFRFIELIKFIWGYRSEGVSVVRKLISL